MQARGKGTKLSCQDSAASYANSNRDNSATLQKASQPRQGHSPGFTVLLTGLSGAGKTTVAHELGSRFALAGYRVTLLDGDELRSRISPDLGFSRADREANLRRAGLIAAEVVKHGGIVICSFIAPYEQSRREIRETVQQHGRFFLVHLSTPLEECERRDPKGLYRKARAGLLSSFTGISDIYEIPVECEVVIDTTGMTVSETADQIGCRLIASGLPPGVWLAADVHLPHNANSPQELPRHPFLISNEKRHARLFHSVLDAITQRRVTLSEIAREVGVERHTLEKVIRLITGQSFRHLRQTVLLARAKTLLDQGKAIKEVAFELGFVHPQSFHRFVRKSSGTTPLSLAEKAG
jgi:adenylyl-sulfate kinase